MRTLTALALLAGGCTAPVDQADGPTDTGSPVGSPTGDTATGVQTTSDDGACGEVTVWDLTVRGVVHNAQGVGAPFASVWLEDRGWATTVEVLGTTTTDGQGGFELAVTGLTSVEDCWGTLLNYVLVAELGPQRGEDEINTWLFTAISNGTLVADLSTSPLVMEDTSSR